MEVSVMDLKTIKKYVQEMLDAINKLEEINVETVTIYESPIVIYGSRREGNVLKKKHAVPIEYSKTEGGFKIIELPNYKGVLLMIYDPSIKKKKIKRRK